VVATITSLAWAVGTYSLAVLGVTAFGAAQEETQLLLAMGCEIASEEAPAAITVKSTALATSSPEWRP
jgi:hypothetical protein